MKKMIFDVEDRFANYVDEMSRTCGISKKSYILMLLAQDADKKGIDLLTETYNDVHTPKDYY